jgi:S-adenosyl-L-methionine hydrolase (adenosine-forming)
VTIVTLLTDFGLSDTYVGQMKGAILSIAPSASLVDLSHTVPPQDVRAGAFLLCTAVGAFPLGTVHLAVVDPGVGSARRAVALETRRGEYLVGPDNGLLMPAAERLGGVAGAVQLETPRGASATFHGRDIFAPTAARLASGTPLSDLGASAANLIELRIAEPNGDVGQIVHVDTYGNLITNFPSDRVSSEFAVQLGERVIQSANHYAQVAPGELLVLVGSAGLVEISMRDGSAAERLGAGRGTPVRLLSRRPPPG